MADESKAPGDAQGSTKAAEKPQVKSGARGPEIGHDELKEVALVIYAQMVQRGSFDGFQAETVAKRAFQRAKAFLVMDAMIRSGEMSADAPRELAPEEFENEVWVLMDDNGTGIRGQTWSPLLDERTNKPITELQTRDFDAFCPNLPPDHPQNRRFKSRDGLVLKTVKGKTVPVKPEK